MATDTTTQDGVETVDIKQIRRGDIIAFSHEGDFVRAEVAGIAAYPPNPHIHVVLLADATTVNLRDTVQRLVGAAAAAWRAEQRAEVARGQIVQMLNELAHHVRSGRLPRPTHDMLSILYEVSTVEDLRQAAELYDKPAAGLGTGKYLAVEVQYGPHHVEFYCVNPDYKEEAKV